MYNDVAKNLEIFNLKSPMTIVPTPNQDDYLLGFIRRYFIQKVNDENSFIFEVAEDVYNEYTHNPFWKGDTIKWRIKGPLQSVYKENGEIDDLDVASSNKAAIARAQTKLKNIGLYLPNLLQFYK